MCQTFSNVLVFAQMCDIFVRKLSEFYPRQALHKKKNFSRKTKESFFMSFASVPEIFAPFLLCWKVFQIEIFFHSHSDLQCFSLLARVVNIMKVGEKNGHSLQGMIMLCCKLMQDRIVALSSISQLRCRESS